MPTLANDPFSLNSFLQSAAPPQTSTATSGLTGIKSPPLNTAVNIKTSTPQITALNPLGTEYPLLNPWENPTARAVAALNPSSSTVNQPILSPVFKPEAIQNFAVLGGTFRGTQAQYNDYIASHPQTPTNVATTVSGSTLPPKTSPTTNYSPNVPPPPAPTNPAQITAESMGANVPADLPGDTTGGDTGNPDAVVAGAKALTLAEAQKQLTPELTEADKSRQSFLDSMASLTDEYKNLPTDQLNAENTAQLPEMKKAYADLNAQIAAKSAEYDALSVNAEGQRIPMSFITGQQAQIRNQKAAEIGMLQARALGIQGQITTAQETVNRAIDLKYKTYENQLKVYEAQLKALEPTLNREEKTLAAAQQMVIDQQKEALANKKTLESNIQKLMLDYYQNGGNNPAIAEMIANAKTIEEATQIYGMNTPGKTDTTADYKNWVAAGGQAGTGQTFAEWLGKGATAGSPYAVERTNRAIQSVDEITSQVNNSNTGWRALFAGYLPESQARYLRDQLTTLKSSIASSELVAMREASKTGGALGNVSDRDIGLLESALGSLDNLQSDVQLKAQLARIKTILTNWQEAQQKYGGQTGSNSSEFGW